MLNVRANCKEKYFLLKTSELEIVTVNCTITRLQHYPFST